jgi:type I restriction enzyme, S subunit
MNPAQLLTHFDRISEAPDAIPRLRRFILDLAVRGKFIEQDPRDEPASELLKRIKIQKARLVKRTDGKIDVLAPLATGEAPFKLPAGWIWTTLGEICSKTGSGSTPRGGQTAYKDCGVPFLRSQNIYDEGLRLTDVAYIDRQTHQKMEGTAVKTADLLLNITGGSMGRCCRVPDDFDEANVSQHVAIIRVVVPGTQDFLHLLILSPYFQSFIFDEQTGAGRGGLPKHKMDRIPVALPPLAEQHRIVVKVDELMALCDRLQAAQGERESRRDRLAAASLNHLNQLANDPCVFQDHARFYFNHLPRLTTRPEHIKQLRQTILNLAVRGKLVPQDSKEEPAAELLKQIQGEQEELIEARVLKRGGEDSGLLEEEDLPFDLPPTWQWAPLRSTIVFGPQNGISPKPSSLPDAPRAITLTATTSGKFNPLHFKRVEATIPPDSEFWLRSGDLLFQRGNTREYVGIAAYYGGEPKLFLYPDLMMKVRLSQKISLRYVHLGNSSACTCLFC